MKIKECYISHNGISCFTDINTLININNININKKIDINKNNIFLYLIIRTCEFIIKDLMSNKSYLLDCDNGIFESISFN